MDQINANGKLLVSLSQTRHSAQTGGKTAIGSQALIIAACSATMSFAALALCRRPAAGAGRLKFAVALPSQTRHSAQTGGKTAIGSQVPTIAACSATMSFAALALCRRPAAGAGRLKFAVTHALLRQTLNSAQTEGRTAIGSQVPTIAACSATMSFAAPVLCRRPAAGAGRQKSAVSLVLPRLTQLSAYVTGKIAATTRLMIIAALPVPQIAGPVPITLLALAQIHANVQGFALLQTEPVAISLTTV